MNNSMQIESKEKNKMSLISNILFFFSSSLLIYSSNANVQDFCVGDLAEPEGPAGYSCRKASSINVNDFIYPHFSTPVTNIPSLKLSITKAFSPQFKAVNGLAISGLYGEIGPGGVVPVHIHPEGSEFSVVTQGSILYGFITEDNKVYYKTLQSGDAIVQPQGTVHFQLNVGKTTAKFISTYSSANPRVLLIGKALFDNDLPTDILAKVTLLDEDAVKKLKAFYGDGGKH